MGPEDSRFADRRRAARLALPVLLVLSLLSMRAAGGVHAQAAQDPTAQLLDNEGHRSASWTANVGCHWRQPSWWDRI